MEGKDVDADADAERHQYLGDERIGRGLRFDGEDGGLSEVRFQMGSSASNGSGKYEVRVGLCYRRNFRNQVKYDQHGWGIVAPFNSRMMSSVVDTL